MADVSIATGGMIREESMAGKMVGIKTKYIEYASSTSYRLGNGRGGGEWDDLSCVTCVTIKFI